MLSLGGGGGGVGSCELFFEVPKPNALRRAARPGEVLRIAAGGEDGRRVDNFVEESEAERLVFVVVVVVVEVKIVVRVAVGVRLSPRSLLLLRLHVEDEIPLAGEVDSLVESATEEADQLEGIAGGHCNKCGSSEMATSVKIKACPKSSCDARKSL